MMDKLKHFAVCFCITLIFGLIHPALGASVAMAVGIGKEAYDRSCGGIFDWLDIAADAAGAGLAVAIIAIPLL